jgi:hypothetical protein
VVAEAEIVAVTVCMNYEEEACVCERERGGRGEGRAGGREGERV